MGFSLKTYLKKAAKGVGGELKKINVGKQLTRSVKQGLGGVFTGAKQAADDLHEVTATAATVRNMMPYLLAGLGLLAVFLIVRKR